MLGIEFGDHHICIDTHTRSFLFSCLGFDKGLSRQKARGPHTRSPRFFCFFFFFLCFRSARMSRTPGTGPSWRSLCGRPWWRRSALWRTREPGRAQKIRKRLHLGFIRFPKGFLCSFFLKGGGFGFFVFLPGRTPRGSARKHLVLLVLTAIGQRIFRL